MDIGKHYIEVTITKLEEYKTKAEKAISQIEDPKRLFWLPDDESNSIALIMKHITGNMRSRWTDFLTTDGEKADRNRPSEFDQQWVENREELMKRWENGWSIMFNTLNNLKPSDLLSTIIIRNKPHTVVEAIQRQLTHYAEHIGQIVFLAKYISENWESLSIPRQK